MLQLRSNMFYGTKNPFSSTATIQACFCEDVRLDPILKQGMRLINGIFGINSDERSTGSTYIRSTLAAAS